MAEMREFGWGSDDDERTKLSFVCFCLSKFLSVSSLTTTWNRASPSKNGVFLISYAAKKSKKQSANENASFNGTFENAAENEPFGVSQLNSDSTAGVSGKIGAAGGGLQGEGEKVRKRGLP